MGWTADEVRSLRQERGESQGAFASALGVNRVTVSEWETGKVTVSPLAAAKLDALARRPTSAPDDYERGLLYACEAMSETIARLLREQREADTALRAKAVGLIPPVPTGDQPASETPPRRRRRGTG